MLIIEQPIITEKSLQLAQQGTYTFAVDTAATKNEIAKAAEKLYGIEVTKVRVQSKVGKRVRRRTGIGKEKDWKKALISVKAGQSIKEFELKEEQTEKKADKKKDSKE